MRIFCSSKFHAFMTKEQIPIKSIIDMAKNFGTGKAIVSLGGGVYKQRLSRPGEGKSGGYRVILCNKSNRLLFFVHGFSKSSFDNITQSELADLKKLAKLLFNLTDAQLTIAVAEGKLREFNEKAI